MLIIKEKRIGQRTSLDHFLVLKESKHKEPRAGLLFLMSSDFLSKIDLSILTNKRKKG